MKDIWVWRTLQNILQNTCLPLLPCLHYLHASNSSFQYFSTSLYSYFENVILKSNLYYNNRTILEDINNIWILPLLFMARQCDLCLKRSEGYKLHWKTINEKSKVVNIYNEQQRLRYYYYNSISFQKLRGEFKIQCKNLSWFNSSIYDARKNDLKCTPMTSKWVTMKNNVKKCVRLMAVTLIPNRVRMKHLSESVNWCSGD